ncbi:MAG: hypothetical protein KC535_04510 [Nanoarchaeota archaeon]|nr:hypothetical protein [Nanoarchaeota archaeon]
MDQQTNQDLFSLLKNRYFQTFSTKEEKGVRILTYTGFQPWFHYRAIIPQGQSPFAHKTFIQYFDRFDKEVSWRFIPNSSYLQSLESAPLMRQLPRYLKKVLEDPEMTPLEELDLPQNYVISTLQPELVLQSFVEERPNLNDHLHQEPRPFLPLNKISF